MSAFVPDAPPGESGADTRDEPLPPAALRLAASRERMRQWMLQTDGRHGARRRVEAAREAGDKPAWMDRLRTAPVVGVVIDAASAWWANHPMQPAATMVQEVMRDAVAPLARRHPVLVVTAAFLAGVALVRWRPWRWLVKPVLFAGLGSQILTHLVASIPLETVLEAVGSFARRPARDKEDDEVNAAATASSVPEAVAP